ncbi:LOW QUALITY PROTEIN: macoilin-2 [Symphorus nematophorus]
MKRRNADCSKLRRPLKRNRITEGIYGSTFLYLKFLVVWALVLLADFVLEFRFEYLWPFWLFIRSVYDSFRYQGLAFSVFFVCVAFTSDIICLLFIPVQWLFFAASTYVWVQYVWHTERGVCLPTVSLWILFVYIEAAIRFKDLKNFHVDLCRPFAAHLEQDVKKLKADLQASRQVEQDLRSQIGSLGSAERSIRTELGQLRQENELLQNKLHNAVQAKQKDKQAVGQLEKRLKAEQEARATAEKQLADEKKRKKLEEATAARAVALAAASRGECTDTLRRRITELETECKKLTMDIKLKEDQIRELELKVQELHKYKENEKDTEVLMSALSAMQDKTQHLENSLSAETRIKLDLFSALGDAKRQLEIAQGQILQKDQEIKDLKQKIAEVMAVMPSISYTADTSSMTPVAPHYSSKFMDTNPSGLDPNASVYQPLKK